MRTLASVAALTLVILTVPSRAQTPSWQLSATVAESCSCVVACACNFGGEPSRMPCEGNRIISIEKGQYGEIDLAGVQFLVTFSMRTWSKIYVSEKVSERQMAAVESLLPLAFAGFHNGMLSFSKAPVTMEVTDTRVRFSGPESSVDMQIMRGFNGRSVKVLNLPNPAFQDYTQYKSVTHRHTSPTHSCSHSGTNGFTSHMEAASK